MGNSGRLALFLFLVSFYNKVNGRGIIFHDGVDATEDGGCPYGEPPRKTFLYHNETGRCFLAGHRGPCGEMMILYQDAKNIDLGFCACDDTLSEWDQTEPEHCRITQRRKLYWPRHKRCYAFFDRGPCVTGQWLVLNESLIPSCQTNPCPAHDDDDPNNAEFWFLDEDQKCQLTYTYGDCPNNRFNILKENSWKPTCSSRSGFKDGILYKIDPPKKKELDTEEDSQEDESEEEQDEDEFQRSFEDPFVTHWKQRVPYKTSRSNIRVMSSFCKQIRPRLLRCFKGPEKGIRGPCAKLLTH